MRNLPRHFFFDNFFVRNTALEEILHAGSAAEAFLHKPPGSSLLKWYVYLPNLLWRALLTSSAFLQITGVEALHKRRIIHHNLKADNILIDDDGHVTLTNLGSAVTFGGTINEDFVRNDVQQKRSAGRSRPLPADQDTTAHIAGKPGYMAPEILGEERHSYGVDVFSMGVVAHLLVYGNVRLLSRTCSCLPLLTTHLFPHRCPTVSIVPRALKRYTAGLRMLL